MGKRDVKENYTISATLNTTMATKATKSGIIPMLRDVLSVLFHLLEAESISLADNSRIRPITASTPYSGSPMPVVIEIAPAADEIALVVEITLVSTIIHFLPMYIEI